MKMRQYGYSYFLEIIRIFLQVVCTIVLDVSAVLEACTPGRAERVKQATSGRQMERIGGLIDTSKGPRITFVSVDDPSLKTTNTRGPKHVPVCRAVRSKPVREGEIEQMALSRTTWIAAGLLARLLMIAVLAMTVQSRFANRVHYDFKAAGYNNDLQSYTYVYVSAGAGVVVDTAYY